MRLQTAERLWREAPSRMQSRSSLPRVSVVTPSFNQGDYIERTIDSVLSQGYPNLEYIVIDGGSTDQSLDVIRKYERHLSGWLSERDRGQSDAINKGFARASGSIFTWLNSDDWYESGALSALTAGFGEESNVGVVVGSGRIVDGAGNLAYDKPAPPAINFDSLCAWLSGGDFMQPSAAFSRAAWLAAGPLNEDVHIALDVDLWLRIAKAGFAFRTVPKLVSSALTHPKAKTTAFVDEMLLDCARVISRHGSSRGYEDALATILRQRKEVRDETEWCEMRLVWLEKNYRLVALHPLVRLLQPLVKRFSKEGRYWPRELPQWLSDAGR